MANVNFMKFIDKYVFSIFLYLLLFFKLFDFRKKNINKNVLFIRLWALGDTINTLPAIEKLNKEGYTVDVLTTNEMKDVFSNLKFINKIILLEYKKPFRTFSLINALNKNKYSIVIDTEQFLNISAILGIFVAFKTYIGFNHIVKRKAFTKVIAYSQKDHFVINFANLLKGLNINYVPTKLVPLYYDKKVEPKINLILNKYKKKKLIGVHLGSGGTGIGRRWSNLKFLELVKLITKKYPDVTIIFTGVPNEISLYDDIKDKLPKNRCLCLIGKTSKDEIAYLIKNLDLFICNDTGVMHLSAAMGTKTLALFGITNPEHVGAFPITKNILIHKNPKHNPVIDSLYSKIPNEKCSTMDLITVKEVYAEVQKVLDKL